MDRLKDSRAKLKDRFRNLHIKEATEFPDNDSFIEELMKEELKCLRKERSSESGDMDLEVFIRLTCPCNVYPLIPHFYIVKFRFTGVCSFFLFFAPKHRLWVLLEPPRRGVSNMHPQSLF